MINYSTIILLIFSHLKQNGSCSGILRSQHLQHCFIFSQKEEKRKSENWKLGQGEIKKPGRPRHKYFAVKSNIKFCPLLRFGRYSDRWDDVSPQTQQNGNSTFFLLKVNLRIPSHHHFVTLVRNLFSVILEASCPRSPLLVAHYKDDFWSLIIVHSSSYLSSNAMLKGKDMKK